jgi:hypothetical protein
MSRRRPRRPQPTTDRRPPEQRLELLVREPNPDRATRMLGRIRADLDAGGELGPWLDAARALRDRLVISESAYVYFAELFTESVLLQAVEEDAELVRLREEIVAVESAHGLVDGEYWPVDEGPDDWRELNEQWDARADAVVVDALRRHHHDELAELREKKLRDYDDRVTQGRIDLWGADDDDV